MHRCLNRFSLRSLVVSATTALVALVISVPPAMAVTFEWEATVASGLNAGMIATDSAGRVYAPVRGAGRVLVYNSARGNNSLLASIGLGYLQDPVSVAVDNRLNIYVADAATNTIVLFGPLLTGAKYLGTSGAPGSALGQISQPQQIAADYEPRVYVAEQGTRRVQSFDPARGALGVLFAFGVADPAPFGPPVGLVLSNGAKHIYVSSNTSGAAGVRVYDWRGVFVGVVAPEGIGSGQVQGPAGLGVDPLGRLLVADTGNNRVSLFGGIAQGSVALGSYGTAGGGIGEFNAPTSLALAPGALLYVADGGNGRIVRIRFDDVDRDGALDGADNCAGLANQDQIDHDGDGVGDACDADDDNDGFLDGQDACPVTAPAVDENRDGCSDPVTVAITPRPGRKLRSRSSALTIGGRAQADRLGVAIVRAAVLHRRGAHCYWWSARTQRFGGGSCARPRFVRARGTTRWRLRIDARLRPGSYKIYSQAIQRKTNLRERDGRAKTVFTVSARR